MYYVLIKFLFYLTAFVKQEDDDHLIPLPLFMLISNLRQYSPRSINSKERN